jgi:lipoprotein-anchoring transpeptidase ErfK/SrfK
MTPMTLISAGSRLSRRRLRRSVAAAATACLLGVVASAANAAGPQTRVPATRQLAVLLTAQRAYANPAVGSVEVALVAARRPLTGERTTLPVVGHATTPSGERWLRVMLPGRPNGSTGWIAMRDTREFVSSWHIVVNLARRRVTVYRDGHVLRTFAAVVGKPSTPTPAGEFFVEETLKMAAGEAGGPFALALSARSNVLQEFEGGPGQIGIHGRDNLGGTLGTAASHGCVRLATSSIDWLAFRIGPGTPVTIDEG